MKNKDYYHVEYKDVSGAITEMNIHTNDIQHELREIANTPFWGEFTSVKKTK
jgi:hypothetical protein